MSNIEVLKEQARRHEQDEEWQKACDLYLRAIDRLGDEDQADIGLYNRVGDLQIRLGAFEDAVRHFEKAVDLYVEAELPNNAIAVCKKVVRHVPARTDTYLRMGKIRASQGFLVDAREYFLTYAERMQAAGQVDQALEALVDFAELAPEDTETRLAVAAQLVQHGRRPEALEQLAAGYRVLASRGDSDGARAFEEKILDLDPEADLHVLSQPPEDEELAFEATALGDLGGADGLAEALEELDLEPTAREEPHVGEPVGTEPEMDASVEAAAADAPNDEVQWEAEVEHEDTTAGEAWADGLAEELAVEVEGPELEFLERDEPEGELPLLDVDDGDAAVEVSPVALETSEGWDDPSWGELGIRDEHAPEVAAVDAAPSLRDRWEAARDRSRAQPADRTSAEDMVELAFQLDDPDTLVESYLALAGAIRAGGEDDRAAAVFRQVLTLDPANAVALGALGEGGGESGTETESGEADAASGSFVDLGALVLDQEPAERTTRFRVAYEEPTGDEDADFARMLSQFKEKVAENFDLADVKAHHDLGTAYKEMGLLTEAVEKFQEALRASPTHLPTYEMLGQVFMDQGEDAAAVKVLERALRVPTTVEDELIGIYYYLARAHERLGNADGALEFYGRVFALDINFADVTDRLRRLR